MTSYPEAIVLRILKFEKKGELRFGLGRSKSIFGVRRGQTSSLQWGPHVVRSDGKVSIERNCVSLSLSLLMSKNLKLKRVIKDSYLNNFVFSDSYMHMFMNICERFPYRYKHVYISRINIWLCYTEIKMLYEGDGDIIASTAPKGWEKNG